MAVDYGADQAFTITPATGHHVADVLVDGVSQGPLTSYKFTAVTGAHTIAASFAIDTFTLTYAAGTGGTVTGASPQTVDYDGSGSEVTAVPAEHYHFVALERRRHRREPHRRQRQSRPQRHRRVRHRHQQDQRLGHGRRHDRPHR